jgi:hypothetical protein
MAVPDRAVAEDDVGAAGGEVGQQALGLVLAADQARHDNWQS